MKCWKKKKVDCIDICLPAFLALEMLKKGAEAKKHVLCEKPLTLTLEDADKMIEAVKKNKVKAMVGHVLRFWPEYVKARDGFKWRDRRAASCIL
ncbi:MAG: Gfo/Idh/MocA family oxidoreductase [Candidatus Humimicrobiaceae bacterium]